MMKPINRLTKFSLVAIAALTLSACTGQPVIKDYDSRVKFETLKSVQWLPNSMASNPLIASFKAENALMAVRIQNAIERNLRAKNLQWTNNQADAYVSFYAKQSNYMTPEPAQFTFGIGSFHRFGGVWYEPAPEYVERTRADLVIQISNQQAQVIWEAKTEIDLEMDDTPQQKEQHIQQLVDTMLKEFPPTP